MIITRTPFRISFFGGGTDYPAWFQENRGAVISTTIDKYCFLSLRKLPPFFEFKYRVAYSKVENVKHLDDLEHKAVKAILKNTKVKEGLEIHCESDLPARSGIGSSSSFVVGLLNAVYAYQNISTSKSKLAIDAINIETNILKEVGGIQDQYATSFGGLNLIEFNNDSSVQVKPVNISDKRKKELNQSLMLFFTGISRNSSDVSKLFIKNLSLNNDYLNKLKSYVYEAERILFSNCSLKDFGYLLEDSWKIKKKLSDGITNRTIDLIYKKAIEAGATGGKLLGAGAGGFILLAVEPKKRIQVLEAMKEYVHVPFEFDSIGSQVIYSDN